MFTGIIEGLGTVTGFRPVSMGKQLTIDADFDLIGTKVGDSIAVDGACLTAVDVRGKWFVVDVSPETLTKTTLEMTKIGNRVNLERALKLGDRLDGHLVSGHIDGIGIIKNRSVKGNAIIISIEVPASLSRYTIVKGSIAVDGTSLTINDCDKAIIRVSIIPHTSGVTTITKKKVGDPVNIETDMIGKYVERLMQNKPRSQSQYTDEGSSLDMDVLRKSGFL